jgi:hypothetical protein
MPFYFAGTSMSYLHNSSSVLKKARFSCSSTYCIFQVFLVDSHTMAVKQLHDNDLFEVEGRALKWKAQTGNHL